MPFINRITNNITPKRVLALCKLSHERSLTIHEIKYYMQPETLNNNLTAINEVLRFSFRGGLIREQENEVISCNLSASEINDLDLFRYTIAQKALNDPDLVFSRFSSWYIARGQKVYNESSENIIKAFDKEINISGEKNIYNKTNLVAWRNWANFLGIGYVHNGVLIPNLAVRLKDLIRYNKFKINENYVFTNFLNEINKFTGEIDGGEIYQQNKGNAEKSEKELSLALSNGLRILEKKGKIELKYVPDTLDKWQLVHPQKEISDIIIKDLINNE